VVEKNIDFLTRRWWRTADVATAEEAQASLDIFCETIGDARPRHDLDGRPSTVAALAEHERLGKLPDGPVPRHDGGDPQGRRQRDRGLPRQPLLGRPGPGRPRGAGPRRPGLGQIDIIDLASGLLARHRLVAPGQGALVRDGAHAVALEAAVLARSPPTSPAPARPTAHRRRPAKQLAAAIRGDQPTPRPGDAVVIDLGRWAAHAPEAGR
jgi:hypothetical protein